METHQLLSDLEFKRHVDQAHAEGLHADHNGRALRWTLLPGQSMPPNSSPHSPVYLVVLQGTGYFTGADGEEKLLGPNDMAVFAPNEIHTARPEAGRLVFLTIQHEAPNPKHGH